jgi:hypothetical protein
VAGTSLPCRVVNTATGYHEVVAMTERHSTKFEPLIKLSKLDKLYPEFPLFPPRMVVGARSFAASCTTSARGTTRTAPSRSSWRRGTTCIPGASRAPTPRPAQIGRVTNQATPALHPGAKHG